VTGDFRVGAWLVRPSLNTISQNGSSSRLEPKVMRVFVCLASQPGEVVSKEALIKSVWSDTFVGDDVLLRAVSKLRRALHDDAREPRFVETIPKRGYRIVAPVEVEQPRLCLPVVSRVAANRRKWLILIALFASTAVAILVALLRQSRAANSSAATKIHSLAVLPLENLSGDPTQDYFSDGITDGLITNLAHVRSLRVISRTVVHAVQTDEESTARNSQGVSQPRFDPRPAGPIFCSANPAVRRN
jgi:DNA-binding winged helix-turn-helix (wHTH) protein